MKTQTKFSGLDVHKDADAIVIAVAERDRNADVRLYGTIPYQLERFARSVRQIEQPGIRPKPLTKRLNEGPTLGSIRQGNRDISREALCIFREIRNRLSTAATVFNVTCPPLFSHAV